MTFVVYITQKPTDNIDYVKEVNFNIFFTYIKDKVQQEKFIMNTEYSLHSLYCYLLCTSSIWGRMRMRSCRGLGFDSFVTDSLEHYYTSPLQRLTVWTHDKNISLLLIFIMRPPCHTIHYKITSKPRASFCILT